MIELCAQIKAIPPTVPGRFYKASGPEAVVYHGYGGTIEAAVSDARQRVAKAKARAVGKPIIINAPPPSPPLFRQ